MVIYSPEANYFMIIICVLCNLYVIEITSELIYRYPLVFPTLFNYNHYVIFTDIMH
jgi:hypothetical protein